MKFITGKYLAFVLDEASRNKLIKISPPQFSKVICHHVTIIFKLNQGLLDSFTQSETEDPTVEVTGVVSDDKIECFTVEINGKSKRIEGGFYHITHSLTPPAKPVQSNDLLKKVNGVPSIPFQQKIKVTGKLQLC